MKTNNQTPIITASIEGFRGNLIDANISDADDKEHGIEPGIGQVVELRAGGRRFIGEVVDRTKVRDDEGNFSVDLVIEPSLGDEPVFEEMRRCTFKGHFIEVVRKGNDTLVRIGFIGGEATENFWVAGCTARSKATAEQAGIKRVRERSL